MNRVPLRELQDRFDRFRVQMEEMDPEWELAVIFGKINQYYFTGTMQDGMLLLYRDGDAEYWVRRSFERALDESFLPGIRKMDSFRDAAKSFREFPDSVYLETEIVPLALLQRFQKHFPIADIRSVDQQISRIRSVKSNFEISLMEEAGKIHQRVLEDLVPDLLREGMSELEFAGNLYSTLLAEGHQGIVRFGMFNTEMLIGQIGFGESSLYPTSFDGPGGNYGLNPAVPLLGSRDRKLRSGDLVFVDVGCGVGGYHTDKTMTYMFGRSLPDDAIEAHERCFDIQNEMVSLLVPGETPSGIFDQIVNGLSKEFRTNFMGYGNRQAKFLGHGIGLVVDEMPVIAKGFDEPLQEGMVLALEPKKGVAGIGMVGIENTFLVTPSGGRCITGDDPGLMKVY